MESQDFKIYHYKLCFNNKSTVTDTIIDKGITEAALLCKAYLSKKVDILSKIDEN